MESNDKKAKYKDDETIVRPIQTIQRKAVARPALLVISGNDIGRSFMLQKDEFMIGRVENCDLVIDDELTSRHHCKITVDQTGSKLTDLQSTNGTFLNGRKVTAESTLQEGDQIQVGSTVILKFHYQEEVETRFLNNLYQAATKDFLTNVYNKKYLLDRLQAEFSYTLRHDGSLSVIVIDIDHFKKVNDTYGHLAGDICLQKVAHFLSTHTRRDDVVARFGGEEFVILMRDCDLAQARSLAENLRQGISETIIGAPTATFKVTASFGVACLSQQTRGEIMRYEHLLERQTLCFTKPRIPVEIEFADSDCSAHDVTR